MCQTLQKSYKKGKDEEDERFDGDGVRHIEGLFEGGQRKVEGCGRWRYEIEGRRSREEAALKRRGEEGEFGGDGWGVDLKGRGKGGV